MPARAFSKDHRPSAVACGRPADCDRPAEEPAQGGRKARRVNRKKRRGMLNEFPGEVPTPGNRLSPSKPLGHEPYGSERDRKRRSQTPWALAAVTAPNPNSTAVGELTRAGGALHAPSRLRVLRAPPRSLLLAIDRHRPRVRADGFGLLLLGVAPPITTGDRHDRIRVSTHKSNILDGACSMSALHPTATEYRTLRKVLVVPIRDIAGHSYARHCTSIEAPLSAVSRLARATDFGIIAGLPPRASKSLDAPGTGNA